MRLRDSDKEYIIAYAENNMNCSKAAKSIFLCKNTLAYHLRIISETTGLNPKNFYDLCKLVEMCKE